MLKIIRSKETSEIRGDNLSNVRCKASGLFRYKKMEYLRDRINELSNSSKNKNIRDVYRGRNK
jgi:hypothetical protein